MKIDDIDNPASDSELSGEEIHVGDGEDGTNTEFAPVKDMEEGAAADLPADESVKADPEPEPKREQAIPRARFDELNAKLHAQREENERLRAELEQSAGRKQEPTAKTDVVDIDDLELQHYDAIMEGDRDKAISLRKQINAEIYARAEAASTEKVDRTLSAREEQAELDRAVKGSIEAYPFLNHQSESANVEAIAQVVEWRDFYMSKGDSAGNALLKASAKVGPMYAVADLQAKPTIEPKKDARKDAALARNLADASAQAPAAVAGIGNRATPATLKIENQKDWEKLTNAEREEILMNS